MEEVKKNSEEQQRYVVVTSDSREGTTQLEVHYADLEMVLCSFASIADSFFAFLTESGGPEIPSNEAALLLRSTLVSSLGRDCESDEDDPS